MPFFISTFRYSMFLCVWLLLLSGVVCRSTSAQEREARLDVLRSLDKLESAERNHPRFKAWLADDGWSDLARQLDAGKLADPARVRASIAKLTDGVGGDANAAAVLLATNAWLNVLQTKPGQGEEWITANVATIKESKAQREVFDAEFAAQFGKLDRSLQNSSQSGAKWQAFLLWEVTQKLVRHEPLSKSELSRLESRWTLAQPHWNAISFRRAAHTVLRAIVLARREKEPELAVKLPATLRAFAASQESGASTSPTQLNALDQLDVGAALSVTEHRRAAAPHFQLRIRATALVPDSATPVDETYGINDVFANTRVRGNGRMRGSASIDLRDGLVPTWDLIFKGNSTSSTTGNNSGVTVSSTATATVEGTKRIQWRDTGFVALPAIANANATVSFNGIATGGRRQRQSTARGEVYASRGAAERDTQRAIERACIERLDAQAEKLLDPLNERYEQLFARPINEQQIFAPRIVTSQADGEALWSCWYTMPEGCGVTTLPEPIAAESDWSLAIHEDFLARHFTTLLGGREMSFRELEARFAKFSGRNSTSNVTEEPAEDDASPHVRLRAEKPLEVRLAEQSIVLRVHLEEFVATQGKVSTPTLIEMVYQSALERGMLVLTRNATPTISFVDSMDGTTGRMQTLKSLLRRQVSRAFSDRIEISPAAWLASSDTTLVATRIDAGWLQVGGSISSP